MCPSLERDRLCLTIGGCSPCHSSSAIYISLPSNVSSAFSTVIIANAIFSRCFPLKLELNDMDIFIQFEQKIIEMLMTPKLKISQIVPIYASYNTFCSASPMVQSID